MKRSILVLLCALVMSATSAEAVIISGAVTGGTAGGAFIELDPASTFSVGQDNFNTKNLYAFNEDQNIILTAPLSADVGMLTLPEGTEVASHYIFFDPLNDKTMRGYVIFDAKVLAIMTSTANLAASDFLINNNVTYNSPSLRGLESGDTATIGTVNLNRVNLDLRASSPGDYIRVLTERSPAAAVPEPATMVLFGLGLSGLGLLRRKEA